MPNRMVRDGILRSKRVCSLPPMAELFYRRLMNVVDDFGRYYADPALLLSDCYPLRPSWATEGTISEWLADCGQLIDVYEVNGTHYLQLRDFKQRIRDGQASKFPPFAGIYGGLREVPARATPPATTTPPTTTTPPSADSNETETPRPEPAALSGELPLSAQIQRLINGYQHEAGRKIAGCGPVGLVDGELLDAIVAEAQSAKLTAAAVADVWARKIQGIRSRSERAEDPEAYVRGAMLNELREAAARKKPAARGDPNLRKISDIPALSAT